MTRLIALLVLLVAAPSVALAQGAGDTVEAGKRFSAGVALYNEADYRAALVEFKRAYDLAPNPIVLYNIGQTYFQLQDYAAAYLTLSRFVREAPANAEHRAEVEQTMQQLQSRIGKIHITTNVEGELSIDDEVIGKTTGSAPVLVSVGRRKVRITAPGRVTWERVIDVAAGDSIRQEVALETPKVDAVGPIAPPPKKSSSLVPILWVSTGVLTAGAITMGVFAWRASGELDDLRGEYPVSRSKLEDQASKVGLYSHLADGLGVAAIAVGGTALVITLLRKSSGDSKEHASIGIGPRGIVVGGTF